MECHKHRKTFYSVSSPLGYEFVAGEDGSRGGRKVKLINSFVVTQCWFDVGLCLRLNFSS